MSARLPALVFIQVSLSYYVFLAINDIEIARGLSPFYNCTSLSSVVLGEGLKEIDSEAFVNCGELTEVICAAQDVPSVVSNAFENSNIANATLYVPETSVDAYMATEPWKGFKTIIGGKPKCGKPTIALLNGKLLFYSDTKGVTYKWSCSYDNGNVENEGNEVVPGGTVICHVSVYATKAGYENSDVATFDMEMNIGRKGDVNGDGNVSITDAVSVVNLILSGDASE